MGLPPKVTKFSKDGVEYISSVDQVKYSIQELTRGALRDVGIYVLRKANSNLMTLPGMKHSRRVRGKYSPFEKWVRKKECDLLVGIKIGKSFGESWYAIAQELGTKRMPKKASLRNAVFDNIPTIIEIESKYLSYLTEEAELLKMRLSDIPESEITGGADD